MQRISSDFRFLMATPLLLTALPTGTQVPFGHPEKFNVAWRFTLTDPKGAQQTGFDNGK